jgi:hypothetical protein
VPKEEGASHAVIERIRKIKNGNFIREILGSGFERRAGLFLLGIP